MNLRKVCAYSGALVLSASALVTPMIDNTKKEISAESFATVKATEPVYSSTATLLGDLNQDGQVNALDNIFLSRYLMGEVELTDQELANADVYKDGLVNIKDRIQLYNYLLGWIPNEEFSIERTSQVNEGTITLSIEDTNIELNPWSDNVSSNCYINGEYIMQVPIYLELSNDILDTDNLSALQFKLNLPEVFTIDSVESDYLSTGEISINQDNNTFIITPYESLPLYDDYLLYVNIVVQEDTYVGDANYDITFDTTNAMAIDSNFNEWNVNYQNGEVWLHCQEITTPIQYKATLTKEPDKLVYLIGEEVDLTGGKFDIQSTYTGSLSNADLVEYAGSYTKLDGKGEGTYNINVSLPNWQNYGFNSDPSVNFEVQVVDTFTETVDGITYTVYSNNGNPVAVPIDLDDGATAPTEVYIPTLCRTYPVSTDFVPTVTTTTTPPTTTTTPQLTPPDDWQTTTITTTAIDYPTNLTDEDFDINHDGSINIIDLILLKRRLYGTL